MGIASTAAAASRAAGRQPGQLMVATAKAAGDGNVAKP